MTGQTPITGAEAPAAMIPSTATLAQATAMAQAGKTSKKPTPQRLVEQVGALQQAETIKQLQGQVKQLEAQSKDTGKIFLATTTALITSAFALVAALAWNTAIQALFDLIYPPQAGQGVKAVIGQFIYAVVITLVVVTVIYQFTKLNKRVGGQSLLGEAPKARKES